MTTINRASDLLQQGDHAIVILTDGQNLAFNPGGTTGYSDSWIMAPNRHPNLNRVIIFFRPPGATAAEVIPADWDPPTRVPGSRRYIVNFRNAQRGKFTSMNNWPVFADCGSNPIRYLAK